MAKSDVLVRRHYPHQGRVREVTIDLVARIPGVTTGPASRSYLYYTPAAKRWAEPLQVRVTPL